MSPTNAGFDFRNLQAAPVDSGSFQALSTDLVERTFVAIEAGDFPGVDLPASHDDVYILRVEFHEVCQTVTTLTGDEGGTRSPNRSTTRSPVLLLLWSARSISSTGLLVG